jgi:UDPglucose 6-dehydrogenase
MAGKTVAIWGASFKPNTDRIDNAPSLTVMEALWSQDANVRLYDPQALPRIADRYGQRSDLVLCASAYEALEGADVLLILTEWKEFWSPDFGLIAAQLKEKVIFDGRNLYDPSYLKNLGFRYFGIGRSSEFIQK